MHRKVIILLLAVAFVFLFDIAETAYANDEISVTVNGFAVDFPDQAPVIADGRTLVPVRGVFERMGFEVQWESDTQRIIMSRLGNLITLTIDSDVFEVHGDFGWSEYDGMYYRVRRLRPTLEVPAQIINGRTMIPIREVAESVGFEVTWNYGEIAINTPRRSEGNYKMLDFTVPCGQSATVDYDRSISAQMDEGSNWLIQYPRPTAYDTFRMGIFTAIHSGSLEARVDGVRANGDIYITWIIPRGIAFSMGTWVAFIELCASLIPEQFNILETSRW